MLSFVIAYVKMSEKCNIMVIKKGWNEMKKLISLALVFVLILSLIAACGPSAPPPAPPAGDGEPETITLRWVGFGFEANRHAQDIIDRWHDLHPHIRVEYTELGATADAAGLLRLDTMIAAGEQIDVVYLTTDLFMNRVANGAVASLDDVIAAAGHDFVADYGLMANAVTFDGRIYGVPRAGNTFKVFYNRTMAQEHGITVPPQMTIEQFRDVIIQFSAIEDLTWPAIIHATWAALITGPAAVAGWHPVRREGDSFVPNYDDPRFMQTMQQFRDMAVIDGLIPTTSIIAAESINRRAELAMQNTGLIMDGPFTLIWLQSFMFNEPAHGPLEFELGVAQLPFLNEADKNNASFFDLAGPFFAPRTAAHLPEAYKFMRFMTNENFDINGVFMPIYTNADMTQAVEVFRNFTDENDYLHTDIFPLETAIAAVSVPNDSQLGVFPVDPEIIPFLGPLSVMLAAEIPVYFGGEVELEAFINILQTRGREIIADLS